jgi:hypothetical protein
MARREDETGLGAARVLDADEVQGVLSGAFYSPEPGRSGPRVRKAEPKPAHYKVICISLYNGDLERLDALVDELKSRGLTKANRSISTRFRRGSERLPEGLDVRGQGRFDRERAPGDRVRESESRRVEGVTR